MTADHPVAVQQVQGKWCSARSCLHACEMQANRDRLMILKTTPTLVTRVELIRGTVPELKRNDEHSHAWMTVEVEQPQRYELLISSCDRSGVAGEMIAVSSCDRKPDDWARGLCGKNTFLDITENSFVAPARPHSAPPSLCRQDASFASVKRLSLSHSPSHSVRDVQSSEDTSTISSSLSALGSSSSVDARIEPKVFVGNLNGRLENEAPVTRLTDLMYWQKSGYPSQGSAHSKKADACRPCSFHHTHLRHPDQKPACRMSYMCEFCHGCSKTGDYKSRYRKRRPMPKKGPVKVAL